MSIDLSVTYQRIAELEQYYKNKETQMEAQKPLPSVEASLKYMAWDMKRVANELEKLNKLLEGRMQNSDGVPF